MSSWPLQDAKARLSELVDTTLKKGPQVITRRGVETVVMVSIDEWKRLQGDRTERPSIYKVLVEDGPKFEMVIPDRKSWRWRPSVEFE